MQKNDTNLTLNDLLDANERFALGARGTTNHCPMALIALTKLGATPARLLEFFQMWQSRYALPAPPIDKVIDRAEWKSHLGNATAFGALRRCFQNWIADDGPLAVIVSVLEEVPFAPATEAFHALIRLAYGLEAAHTGEIASGLAALISAYLPIAIQLDHRSVTNTVDHAFCQINEALKENVTPGKSITARLRAVINDGRFDRALLAPPCNSNLLDDIAEATISAYWRTADFTVLHTVTATHAARVLFGRLPSPLIDKLMPNLWIALCAAYATVQKPLNIATPIQNVCTGWDEISGLAVASNNDHIIKMVYTCRNESRRKLSPLYLASAARLVGMNCSIDQEHIAM